MKAIEDKLGLPFVPHPHPRPPSVVDGGKAFTTEDILHYIYAILHSPSYRQRYEEFLKIDFPRVPLSNDLDLWRELCARGSELVSLHLMKSPKLERTSVQFPESGSGMVSSGHPRYVAPGEPAPEGDGELEAGRVYINETQYFEGIDPEVWTFEIGGYQVLKKWLRDRKRADYPLSFDDMRHYQKIVVALEETMRLMEEIDEVIETHGGWPIE